MSAKESGPDEVAFGEDIKKAEFVAGEASGHWGIEVVTWPEALVWLAAGERKNSPPRFHVRAICAGYSARGPTATFWDLKKGVQLEAALWPKGRARVAHVFRTDWEGGRAFYHPFDGLTLEKHPDWPEKYPTKLWTRKRTIADWLAEFHELLNCDEYEGVER